MSDVPTNKKGIRTFAADFARQKEGAQQKKVPDHTPETQANQTKHTIPEATAKSTTNTPKPVPAPDSEDIKEILAQKKPAAAEQTVTKPVPAPKKIPAFHELQKAVANIDTSETTDLNDDKPKSIKSKQGITAKRIVGGGRVIKDTKRGGGPKHSSLLSGISAWFSGFKKRKKTTPKMAIPETSRRKGVIQEATTKTGTIFTADSATLKERIRERARARTAIEDDPEISWSPYTEAGRPLLEAGDTIKQTPTNVQVAFTKPTNPKTPAATLKEDTVAETATEPQPQAVPVPAPVPEEKAAVPKPVTKAAERVWKPSTEPVAVPKPEVAPKPVVKKVVTEDTSTKTDHTRTSQTIPEPVEETEATPAPVSSVSSEPAVHTTVAPKAETVSTPAPQAEATPKKQIVQEPEVVSEPTVAPEPAAVPEPEVTKEPEPEEMVTNEPPSVTPPKAATVTGAVQISSTNRLTMLVSGLIVGLIAVIFVTIQIVSFFGNSENSEATDAGTIVGDQVVTLIIDQSFTAQSLVSTANSGAPGTIEYVLQDSNSNEVAVTVALGLVTDDFPVAVQQFATDVRFVSLNQSRPQLLLKITDQTSVTGALLMNESAVANSLTALFNTAGADEFMDTSVRNIDTRTLIESSEANGLTYGFINDTTLVIAASRQDFEAILNLTE